MGRRSPCWMPQPASRKHFAFQEPVNSKRFRVFDLDEEFNVNDFVDQAVTVTSNPEHKTARRIVNNSEYLGLALTGLNDASVKTIEKILSCKKIIQLLEENLENSRHLISQIQLEIEELEFQLQTI
jgi:hypothetical protein